MRKAQKYLHKAQEEEKKVKKIIKANDELKQQFRFCRYMAMDGQ